MRYILLAGLLVGCTPAEMAQYKAIGKAGHIVCYSGGEKIYEGYSEGKIQTEKKSDGWYFMEKQTGDLIRLSGDCLIRN